MKIKNRRFFIVNSVMFIILSIIVCAMIVYRILHPTPSLEHRACKDRLNNLAVFQQKYFTKNGVYSNELKDLSRDNSIHFFHKCPLTDENFSIETKKDSYIIKCERHNLLINNGILKKY